MFKEVLQSRWFTVAALVIGGVFFILIIKLEPAIVLVSKELKNINQKIDEVEKNNLELDKLGDYLGSDAYLERQARLKLNYKKPDENVVYVYAKNRKTNGAGAENSQETSKILDNKFVENFKKMVVVFG